MREVDPDVVVPITKVNFRPERVSRNGVNDARMIRDVRWLHNSVMSSGNQIMAEPCFLRLINLRNHNHSRCRSIAALVHSS